MALPNQTRTVFSISLVELIRASLLSKTLIACTRLAKFLCKLD